MNSKTPNDLQRFAFNQARFVFATARTIERELMTGIISVPERLTFVLIRATPFGQKYLAHVTFEEVQREIRTPGAFMNANTDLGYWVPDGDNQYVEDFEEK